MPTWQQIARQLANRMANHAYCEDHPPREAQPDTCTYCADREAYTAYVRKLDQG